MSEFILSKKWKAFSLVSTDKVKVVPRAENLRELELGTRERLVFP